MNAYKKGYRGETELAAILTSLLGVEVRRTAAPYLPGIDTLAPDCYGLPGVHLEVKRRQKLSITEALQQARRDAVGNIPLVAHRPNHAPWLVTVELQHLPRLAKIIAELLAAAPLKTVNTNQKPQTL